MYRSIVLLIAKLVWLSPVTAQEKTDTARLLKTLEGIQNVYRNRPLSFDVLYTVANQSQSTILLDSMRGEVAVNGVYCYYRLPSMETITNPRYNIILFKEDKLMYLTKPSIQSVQNPMLQVQALLKTGKLKGISMHEEGKVQSLWITFGEESACKSMVLEIEKATSYVYSIRYELKTEMLPGIFADKVGDDNVTYEKYMIVRLEFRNYKTLDADLSRFDEKNFFFLNGTELKTVSAYNDYTIFKGTPNL